MLTVKQVAERLNVSVAFVYGLLKSGRLRFYRLGKGQGGLRISEAMLQEYLQRAESTSLPAPQPPALPLKLKHLKV